MAVEIVSDPPYHVQHRVLKDRPAVGSDELVPGQFAVIHANDYQSGRDSDAGHLVWCASYERFHDLHNGKQWCLDPRIKVKILRASDAVTLVIK